MNKWNVTTPYGNVKIESETVFVDGPNLMFMNEKDIVSIVGSWAYVIKIDPENERLTLAQANARANPASIDGQLKQALNG